uniref:EGF-like domain-containing protein n=1 Tax=Caenorhabditis japonica TaxID=281687 RepID=A0A8R1E2W5_CAEJA
MGCLRSPRLGSANTIIQQKLGINECSERCWNGETCAVIEHEHLHEIQCQCAGNYTNFACSTHVCDAVCGPRGTCRTTDCPKEHPTCRPYTYCECDEGWTGPECRHKKNAYLCSSHCFNGGRCDGDSPSRLACHCPPGFSGDRCETCANQNHTCLNGGFCAYLPSNKSISHCICPSGFQGDHCEEYLCKDACPYGSKCSYDVTKPLDPIKCFCDQNAAAHNADCSPICHKELSWCHNGGTCVDYPGQPGKCTCPPRFTGPRCDIPVPCEDYCMSNSKCNVINGTHFNCECRKGFSGARCDKDTKCDDCQNNAKCVKRPSGRVQCECPPGIGGDTCDKIVAKSCTDLSCENQGICIEPAHTEQSAPWCLCTPGFGGALCHYHRCDNFCHHDGKCFMDEEHEPRCMCEEAFFGDRCQYRAKNIHLLPQDDGGWSKLLIIVLIALLTILVIVGVIANRSSRFAVLRQFRHNPLQNHGAPPDQFSNPAYMIDEGGIELVTQNTSLVQSHDVRRTSFSFFFFFFEILTKPGKQAPPIFA